VRVFTEGGAQRVRKTLSVGMQFALVDYTILVHVHEFDRVFDGENVVVTLGVDLVDHRGQRGRFAGSGGPRHQYQAAGLLAEFSHNRRQPKLVERFDLKWNDAEHSRGGAALVEHVGTETCQSLQTE